MDDDVEYLGTKFAPHTPLDDPCEPQASVAGITLHVEKCGERPAHKLAFYRARSGYVNIGRKSGSDDKSMRRENDDRNVVFACQVVSARHAKLVLSDSGQVYVVDLHSRHGTHLLRRGEETARMLKAEVETALADGDVLTFGKTVGAGSYLVSPVTVRVEILKGRSSSEAPVSSDRALTPISSLSHHVFSRTRKLSSGRYGLFVPPCVESDSAHSSTSSIEVHSDASSSSSSASEQGSDVEDDPFHVPSVVRDSSPGKNAIKIPTFRSFMREMYNNAGSHSPPIVTDDADEPIEIVAPGSPSDAYAGSQPSPVVVVIDPASKSRSHSPMELSTPSPSPLSEAQHSEPAIIGAWPTSRPESRHSSLEVEVAHSETAQDPEPAVPVPAPTPAQPSTSQNVHNRIPVISEHNPIELTSLRTPPPFFPYPYGGSGPFSNSIASDFGLPPSIQPPPSSARMLPFCPPFKALVDRASSELKASIKSVEDRITTMQESIDDLKSRQSVTEEDIIDLQSQIDMLEPQSERLLCRMNGAERNIASLSLLHGSVNSLRNRLDAPEPSKPQEASLSDVKACAEALSNLVSEMKSLREDVEKRIEEKMDAMKAARSEAFDALKEVTKEAESIRALKRKREEDEEEVEEDEEQRDEQVEEPREHQVDAPDVDMAEPIRSPTPIVDDVDIPLPAPAPAFVPEVKHEAVSPPPRKRARTAMFTVVHTAAAMAVGAAATWSALAFA